MKAASFYRPVVLLLFPCSTLHMAAAFLMYVALVVDQPAWLVFTALLLGLAIAWIRIWSGVRYDIYLEMEYNGHPLPPMLVLSTGRLNHTEVHVPLMHLRHIVVRRPLYWAWCDGAALTLYFADGGSYQLSVVGHATPAVKLLSSILARC